MWSLFSSIFKKRIFQLKKLIGAAVTPGSLTYCKNVRKYFSIFNTVVTKKQDNFLSVIICQTYVATNYTLSY